MFENARVLLSLWLPGPSGWRFLWPVCDDASGEFLCALAAVSRRIEMTSPILFECDAVSVDFLGVINVFNTHSLSFSLGLQKKNVDKR